jgi:hypothetical protein
VSGCRPQSASSGGMGLYSEHYGEERDNTEVERTFSGSAWRDLIILMNSREFFS